MQWKDAFLQPVLGDPPFATKRLAKPSPRHSSPTFPAGVKLCCMSIARWTSGLVLFEVAQTPLGMSSHPARFDKGTVSFDVSLAIPAIREFLHSELKGYEDIWNIPCSSLHTLRRVHPVPQRRTIFQILRCSHELETLIPRGHYELFKWFRHDMLAQLPAATPTMRILIMKTHGRFSPTKCKPVPFPPRTP